jgi:hypothetical protein
MNKPEKRGELIQHLLHALEIADELDDGTTVYGRNDMVGAR